MSQSNQNKMHVLKEKFMTIRDWIMDHSKIVMPLVLIVCVLITILVAVNANHREALEKEAQQVAMSVEENVPIDVSGLAELAAPEFPLEENAYPEINNLVRAYYDALAAGDIEKVSSLNQYLDNLEIIRVEELSKYIDSYTKVDVYTKPGLTENTYVAYVCSEVKFYDVEQSLPGMQTYYIGLNESGEYFLDDSAKTDTSVRSYIDKVTLQDDVVDLNNKIVVAYNELLANDEEVNEFMAYLGEKINEDVGEVLAEAEQANQPQEQEDEEQTTSSNISVVQTVRATAVVNIRSSDSEEADRLDRAQVGQEFELLEQRGNGWSMVSYNGGAAFIKSDYLEVVSSVTVDVPEQENSNSQETQQNNQNEPQQAAASTENTTPSGTVKVKESVRVRASASTSAEVLGTVYAGDELELLMVQADGWTKVKYKGQTAFVKSEYVE